MSDKLLSALGGSGESPRRRESKRVSFQDDLIDDDSGQEEMEYENAEEEIEDEPEEEEYFDEEDEGEEGEYDEREIPPYFDEEEYLEYAARKAFLKSKAKERARRREAEEAELERLQQQRQDAVANSAHSLRKAISRSKMPRQEKAKLKALGKALGLDLLQ